MSRRLGVTAAHRGLLQYQHVATFSTNKSTPEDIVIETESNVRAEETAKEQPEVVVNQEPVMGQAEKMTFQAETRKLLDIVAKSIYTDKEVFIRELLSNCSDALEKLRYAEISGQTGGKISSDDQMFISVETSEKERMITIFDSGIGMTREQIAENLGTIAKSGSQEFKNVIENAGEGSDAAENIIGQFGVGFYSAFIVSDYVEVFSKSALDGQGVKWCSDGSGEYEVANVKNLDFDQGTKIVLRLRKDAIQFSREQEVEKIIRKYSVFNKYPIKLNGSLVNNLQAIWYRDKREVTLDEYERFYEQIADTKIPYKYKLHYSTEVPLEIRALFYIPTTHGERVQMMQSEKLQMHLYSRKVLIKESCKELVPAYLRFVKGIVDCEDLPLNISRETYQDSNLIGKLRNVVTRRILKMLEDEMKRDKKAYDRWFQEFQMFLKEGVMSDTENQEQLLRLMRYETFVSGESNSSSLEDYVAQMKEKQTKIYYIAAADFKTAMESPFIAPFKDSDVPVLLVSQQFDEMIFNQIGNYKSKTFVNIESTSFDEIQKDLGEQTSKKDIYENMETIPEEDVTAFMIWLKEYGKPYVSKVTLSRRLQDVPMVLFGQVSASMRHMMTMMQAQNPGNVDPAEISRQLEQMSHNQTMEINPAHPIVIKLNKLRKIDEQRARNVQKQLLDNALAGSGVPVDMKLSAQRNLDIIDDFLKRKTQN